MAKSCDLTAQRTGLRDDLHGTNRKISGEDGRGLGIELAWEPLSRIELVRSDLSQPVVADSIVWSILVRNGY